MTKLMVYQVLLDFYPELHPCNTFLVLHGISIRLNANYNSCPFSVEQSNDAMFCLFVLRSIHLASRLSSHNKFRVDLYIELVL